MQIVRITLSLRSLPHLSDHRALLFPQVRIKLWYENKASRQLLKRQRDQVSSITVSGKGKENDTDRITVCSGNKHVVGDHRRIVALLQGIQEGMMRMWKFRVGLKCAFNKFDNEHQSSMTAQ